MVNDTIVYLMNESLILYQENLKQMFYSKIILILILGYYAFLCYKYSKIVKPKTLVQEIIKMFTKIYYISFLIILPLITGFLTSQLDYWFFFKYLLIGYSIFAVLIFILLFIFGSEYLYNFFTGEYMQLKNETHSKK
jgi:hypothetical protein